MAETTDPTPPADQTQNALADQTTAVVSAPSSTPANLPTAPEQMLRMEQAKADLQKLELNSVADLIQSLERIYAAKLADLDRIIASVTELTRSLTNLHALMMDDSEAQFEILKVFQSRLIVLDQVKEKGVIAAAIEGPTPKK